MPEIKHWENKSYLNIHHFVIPQMIDSSMFILAAAFYFTNLQNVT